MIKASQWGFNSEYAEDAPTFEQVNVLTGDTILEFGAPWCEYCQAARPAVQDVLEEKKNLLHVKVYDGKGKVLGRKFRVKLWPTLILLRDGQEVGRLVRPVGTDEVKELLMQPHS